MLVVVLAAITPHSVRPMFVQRLRPGQGLACGEIFRHYEITSRTIQQMIYRRIRWEASCVAECDYLQQREIVQFAVSNNQIMGNRRPSVLRLRMGLVE